MEELNVRIVELKGSYYQMGVKQSEEIKSTNLMNQLDQLKMLSAETNFIKGQELLKHHSPQLLDELQGIAAGLKMEIKEAIKIYSGYDLFIPAMGCTAFLFDGYYVRNYDFHPD